MTPTPLHVVGAPLITDRERRLAEYLGYRDLALAHAPPFASYWERRS